MSQKYRRNAIWSTTRSRRDTFRGRLAGPSPSDSSSSLKGCRRNLNFLCFLFLLQQLSRFQSSPLQWQKVPLIFQLFLFCLNLWQNAGRETSRPKSHIPVIVSSSNIRLFCVSVFLYQDFLGLWENLLRGLFLLKQSFFTDRAWCGCWGEFRDLGNMTNNESLLLSICCKKRFFCLW